MCELTTIYFVCVCVRMCAFAYMHVRQAVVFSFLFLFLLNVCENILIHIQCTFGYCFPFFTELNVSEMSGSICLYLWMCAWTSILLAYVCVCLCGWSLPLFNVGLNLSFVWSNEYSTAWYIGIILKIHCCIRRGVFNHGFFFFGNLIFFM